MKSSGITATTTTPATIESITISAINSNIAETTNYVINYTPKNIHPAGTIIIVTVPSEFILGTI